MKSFGVEIPFVTHLGFTLHRMEGGESELHYEAKPEHFNSFDVTHGGAVDDPAGRGHGHGRAQRYAGHGRGHHRDEDQLHAARQAARWWPRGGCFTARPRWLSPKARCMTPAGRICSHATGTFKYVKRLPVDGRNINQLKSVSTD